MPQDTYPILQSNNRQFLNWKNLLIAGLLLALLYFICCHHVSKPTANLQPVTSIEKQKEVLRVDSVASKRYNDSVDKLVDKWAANALQANLNRDRIQDENLKIQEQMDNLVVSAVPDTFKAFADKISVLNEKLKKSALEAQKACNKNVNALQGVINQKDALLKNSKNDYNKLRANIDICFKQQAALQANIKKLRPRASIGVGITGITGWAAPYKFDAGAFLYYLGKNGNQLSVGVLTTQQVQVSYSKNLFKF